MPSDNVCMARPSHPTHRRRRAPIQRAHRLPRHHDHVRGHGLACGRSVMDASASMIQAKASDPPPRPHMKLAPPTTGRTWRTSSTAGRTTCLGTRSGCRAATATRTPRRPCTPSRCGRASPSQASGCTSSQGSPRWPAPAPCPRSRRSSTRAESCSSARLVGRSVGRSAITAYQTKHAIRVGFGEDDAA